jgi:hypothetical protein
MALMSENYVPSDYSSTVNSLLTLGGTDVVAGCGVQFLQFVEVWKIIIYGETRQPQAVRLRCWLLVLHLKGADRLPSQVILVLYGFHLFSL